MTPIVTRRLSVLESGRYLMDLRELVAELADLPPHAWIVDAAIEGSQFVISFRVDPPPADDVPLLEQLYHESTMVVPQ